MIVFHGTTHNFNSFDVELTFDKNHVGQAVYLTTCFDDATDNYAGLGPDLRSRISYLEEELLHEVWLNNREEYNEKKKYVREIAEKKLNGGNRFLLHCKIDERANLFLIGDNYCELYSYSEEDECIESPLLKALACYLSQDELNLVVTDSEMRTRDIVKNIICRCCEDEPDLTGQLIRKILLRAGYDGVEYEDAHQFFPYMVQRGTQHFAVYKSELVQIVDREEV